MKRDMELVLKILEFLNDRDEARSQDIVIRSLRELTDDEVTAWGRSVALRLFFYQYSDIALALVFDKCSLPRLELSTLKDELARYPGQQNLHLH